MYAFDFDYETGGVILLDKKSLLNHEIRPVYAPELTELGVADFCEFDPQPDAPYMWRDLGRYYYRGELAFRVLHNAEGKPEIFDRYLQTGATLKKIDVPATLEKNAVLLERLQNQTVEWLRAVYEDRRSKNEFWYVAYSGGKDSQVLLNLTLEALGNNVAVIFGDTTMEYPQTYKAVELAKELCEERGVLFYVAKAPYNAQETWRMFAPPGRRNRWCCDVHKSSPSTVLARSVANGRPIVDIQGVRKSESFTRSKYNAVVPSKVRGATDVRPLLEWGSAEIWMTIYSRGLYVNDLYKLGASRVGCVLCPMASLTSDVFAEKHAPDLYRKLRELIDATYTNERFMHAKPEAWRRRINGDLDASSQRLVDDRIEKDELVIDAFVPELGPNFYEWSKTLPKGFPGWRVKRLKEGDPFTFRIPVEHTKQGRRDRDKFLKFVRRAVYCVGCGVCEANCVSGALKCSDGKVQIDESKCLKCGKCMTGRSSQCLRFKSRCVSRNRDEIIARANRNMERRLHEKEERERERRPLLQFLSERVDQDGDRRL